MTAVATHYQTAPKKTSLSQKPPGGTYSWPRWPSSCGGAQVKLLVLMQEQPIASRCGEAKGQKYLIDVKKSLCCCCLWCQGGSAVWQNPWLNSSSIGPATSLPLANGQPAAVTLGCESLKFS